MRRIYLIISLLASIGINLQAQRERIHLDLDKYTCRAGDTVWFKGTITRASHLSTLSTNLYVQLYSSRGFVLSRSTFPIFSGLTMGQLIINDTIPTDNYYIVASTKEQDNYDNSIFFSVPLLVYNFDKPKREIFHKVRTPVPDSVASTHINGLLWVTSPYRGQMACNLMLDSLPSTKHFQIIKPGHGDTSFISDIRLNNEMPHAYVLVPIDSIREEETLYLFEDSNLLARQLIRLKRITPQVQITTDTIDTAPNGYNSWSVQIPDTSVSYYSSIAVLDADRSIPCPLSIEQLNESYTDNFTTPIHLVDTSYISYSGHATHTFGKAIKDEHSKNLVFALFKDTTFLYTRVARLDSLNNFALDSLFFYDNADLQYQINKQEDGRTKDIKLTLQKYIPPIVDSSVFQIWQDDSMPLGKQDTTFTKQQLDAIDLSKIKTLKAAIVKGRKNMREELDHRYATGAFAEPALYVYDLRADSDQYNRNIYSYLEGKAGLMRDPQSGLFKSMTGKPVRFYLNQQLISQTDLDNINFEYIAYIKILQNDFLEGDGGRMSEFLARMDAESHPKPVIPPTKPNGKPDVGELVKRSQELSDGVMTPYNVCIYMRQGTDYRSMRGGLNKTQIQGYTKILLFQTDKVTLYWKPWETGSHFRIRFTNNDSAKRFRVKVSGISPSGKTVFYETIIE